MVRSNKPGRPRIDPTDETVSVSVRLPGRQYDQIYRRATEARVTVPEIVRRDLRIAAAVAATRLR